MLIVFRKYEKFSRKRSNFYAAYVENEAKKKDGDPWHFFRMLLDKIYR